MGISASDVRAWMVGEWGLDGADLADEAPLFSSGLVDSFAMVDLVSWLEGRGGFTFGPLDVSLDNLDTIERIVAFCASRR